MNDKWQQDEGRWNSSHKQRVAQRFRSHVRTPHNPFGRIHREICFFCLRDARESARERGEPLDLSWMKRADAHHVDYARPFVVAWLCFSHHRAVDHGRKLPPSALHDYTSLVVTKRGLEGNKNQKGPGVPF